MAYHGEEMACCREEMACHSAEMACHSEEMACHSAEMAEEMVVVLEATMCTKIYGQRRLGKCWCVAGSHQLVLVQSP